MNTLVRLLAVVLIAAVTAHAETAEKPQDKPYPFNFCIIQGEEFSPYKDPYIVRHQSQIYKLCCKDCYEEFKKDPAPHVKKFEALVKLRAEEAAAAGKKDAAPAKPQE